MVWFKKEKKSELPELPPMPMPAAPEEEKELPSLPSFPSSRTGERMSRETVKQIIAQPPREEYGEEFEEETPRPAGPMAPVEREVREKGPIFIQIEKYHDLLKALEEAKNKVKDVSETLENIKELKERTTNGDYSACKEFFDIYVFNEEK